RFLRAGVICSPVPAPAEKKGAAPAPVRPLPSLVRDQEDHSMARHPRGRIQPRLEPLETRLALSISPSANTFGISPPANAIDVSLGNLTRPGATAATSVTIAPQNITPRKPSTMLAIFVAPTATSKLAPRIVSAQEDGRALPIQFGRPYQTHPGGRAIDEAVA